MMMRSILLTVLTLLVMRIPVHAYQSVSQHGCDAEHLPGIVSTTTALDYAAACATYTTCLSEGVESALCQMRVVLMMEAGCADRLCEIRARLYAATITLYESPQFIISLDADEVLGDAIPLMLDAFDRGEYAEARDEYLNVSPDAYPHTMLHLSLGLLHEALGDDEAALAVYDQAWEMGFPMPLLYYVRGRLYERLERDIETLIDFQNLADYLVRDLTLDQFTADLLAQYPRDTLVFEEWALYPVLLNSAGPGGDFYIDQTLTARVEMPLAIYDGFLVADAGLPAADEDDFPALRKYSLTLLGDYRLRLPYDVEYGLTTTINFTTEPARLSTEWLIFETYQQVDSLLVPASEPDPRVFLPGTRCPGAARSYLAIGGHGLVSSYFEALTLYDAPDGNETGSLPIAYGVGFTVLEGPVCASAAAWWRIASDEGGLSGWIRESEGDEYLVFPDDSPPLTCEGSLPPRLVGGGRGQVIPDQGANRLRSNPTLNGEVVGEIPAGGIFEVLSAPFCAEGYTWWLVDYSGLTGWTAEGEGDTYWLQPE